MTLLFYYHFFFLQFAGTLETDFIQTAVEALREQCVASAVTNNNASVVQTVIDNSCSNGCSGQGTCLNGKMIRLLNTSV